jgi:2-keto-4-pentenoate hydratase
VADAPVDLDEAYDVQRILTTRRVSNGERRAGWKLGYTSAAMRRQMGIDRPNFAPLTDAMVLSSGDVLPEQGLLQPRVEPEVVLVIGDLDPASAGDVDAVLACVHSAVAGLEVVDSVWTRYRFRLEDNTADGSSAAFAVLGHEVGVTRLADLSVTLYRNGSPVGHGLGRDAMGSPLDALRWLVGALGERGETLRSGDVVLTGGLTAAVPIEPGDVVHADFGGLLVSIRRAGGRS